MLRGTWYYNKEIKGEKILKYILKKLQKKTIQCYIVNVNLNPD